MNKVKLLMLFICMSFFSCSTKKPVVVSNSLEGIWELNYITGPKIAFDGLYPNKKPTIVFNLKENKITGNNSCNQYFGALIIDGTKIDFKDAKMGMSMMACAGNGEAAYMDALNKTESYVISEDWKTLSFLIGNIVLMRFTHK